MKQPQILPNPLRTHKTLAEKQQAYKRDILSSTQAVAYKSDGTQCPLRNVPVDRVEFIGGMWRVQNETCYTISKIRDRYLIIGPQIPYTENTYFKYYKAMRPVFNCYGLISNNFNVVVAHYDTDNGPQYGYGATIQDARAFLGIRLYDEYKDLIHSVVCQRQSEYIK